MKIALVVVALMVAAAPAQAVSRYNSDRLSCAKARAILADEGVAIFRYKSKRNPSLTLYDRYVAGTRFCRVPFEYAARASFATSDRDACPAFKCRQNNDDDYFPFDD